MKLKSILLPIVGVIILKCQCLSSSWLLKDAMYGGIGQLFNVQNENIQTRLIGELLPMPRADGTLDSQMGRIALGFDGRFEYKSKFKASSILPQNIERKFYIRIEDDGIKIYESGNLVFVYNHRPILKKGVPLSQARAAYVHPIYGLNGELLTDDFPIDHYHHRGLFWAWPYIKIGNNRYDLWSLHGITNVFERLITCYPGYKNASIAVENGWYTLEGKVMAERIWLTVSSTINDFRFVEFEGYWSPTKESIFLKGADDKGYGGLTVRFGKGTDLVITTQYGIIPKDLVMTHMEWADLSARFGGDYFSGLTIFTHPDNPNFPHQWLTRHYGVLCVGWPGVNEREVKVGEIIKLRYRLVIHRKLLPYTQLAMMFEDYSRGTDVHFELME